MPPAPSMMSTGRISVHPRGFGFVVGLVGDADDDRDSAFVAPPELNRFLADDVVTCTVERAADGRQSARGLVLAERGRRRLFGRVVRRGTSTFLRTDRVVANTDWPLDDAGDFKDGVTVVADIVGERARCAFSVAGADAEIHELLLRHGLEGDHEAALVAEAERAGAVSVSLEGRRDLRGVVTVTIDGPDTKDIDDALLALPPDADGAVRVIVAIADVSAAVLPGSALDVDAARRATSVYLPGRVLPMLPRRLSEDRLSLNEGQERCAMTAELRIDVEGRVTSVDVHEAVIRSTARLSYDAVARFLDDDDGTAVPEQTRETLLLLRTAAARLSQARAERGGKDVEREEISVRVDEQGAPRELQRRTSNVAHVLVERLMVAANEAVARFLVERGLVGVFRVHDAPTLERTRALADAARALGVVAGFSSTTPLSPKALAAFERQLAGTRHEDAIERAMLRLLGPARYTTTPSPHFGLAAPLYLHFTSPIRRYADLLVHRLLRAYLRGERGPVDTAALERTCTSINDKARRAARAETERARVLVARLFSSRIGQRARGVVVGHKPQGALVQIEGAWALLPGEHPPLGDAVDVVISAVDEELGRIDVARA